MAKMMTKQTTIAASQPRAVAPIRRASTVARAQPDKVILPTLAAIMLTIAPPAFADNPLSGVLGSAKDSARNTADAIKEKSSNAADAIKDSGNPVKDALGSAKEATKDAVDSINDGTFKGINPVIPVKDGLEELGRRERQGAIEKSGISTTSDSPSGGAPERRSGVNITADTASEYRGSEFFKKN